MAQWHRDNPWRQGHLLTLKTARSLGLAHSQSPDDTAVVIISHDCDLAQDIGIEPECEIIIGRTIAQTDGNFANAKSVRRLHLPYFSAKVGSSIAVELESGAKSALKKELIAAHVPDERMVLRTNELTILQTWLAARYRRSSFSDEFDRRLTS